jgi:hypothetical protein
VCIVNVITARSVISLHALVHCLLCCNVSFRQETKYNIFAAPAAESGLNDGTYVTSLL